MPSFSMLEISSSIRRKIFLNSMTSFEAMRILDKIFQLKINFINLSKSEIKESFVIADQINTIPIYDTSYLLIAMNLNIPFITEDKKFLNKAKILHSTSYSVKEFLELKSK